MKEVYLEQKTALTPFSSAFCAFQVEMVPALCAVLSAPLAASGAACCRIQVLSEMSLRACER